MDKVSIIVPVYNVDKYLSRCIESLLNQSYPNLEIIIVDDCSLDSSRSVIKEYAEKDSRIKPIFFDENRGVSVARNTALDTMTGEWVCFCDGDDWYVTDYVEQMINCAEKENADYIICDFNIISDNSPAIKANSLKGLYSGIDNRTVIACGSLYSWTRMVSKNIVKDSSVRYPIGFKQNEEMSVLPVLASCASKIGIVDKPLYYYYQRSSGSASNNLNNNSEKIFLDSYKLLEEAIGSGYERELEFRAVYALFYGEILKLCKNKTPCSEIKKKIFQYEKMYPNYYSNPYLINLGTFKTIFIKMVKIKFIFMLKIMAKIHGLIIH